MKILRVNFATFYFINVFDEETEGTAFFSVHSNGVCKIEDRGSSLGLTSAFNVWKESYRDDMSLDEYFTKMFDATSETLDAPGSNQNVKPK